MRGLCSPRWATAGLEGGAFAPLHACMQGTWRSHGPPGPALQQHRGPYSPPWAAVGPKGGALGLRPPHARMQGTSGRGAAAG
eukprot:CAMPEP_0171157586 /NCGR_PEP_ID=MMETSP0790-20130122/2041_1 /TAXON_ID=2925 /ORGANISM="Alexandrium catenella, Strain OF101" /LENGTH=81 /DNA_ID=CAMNT_0011621939 /DNA_START=20 /DNA_END=261 /DNA_ORIENTATION=-